MFEGLTGNEAAKRVLRGMLEAKRVPGALLFAGEEGAGKKAFALEVARALNCTQSSDVQAPCGVCASCRRLLLASSNLQLDEDDEKDVMIVWSAHPDVGLVGTTKRMIPVTKARAINDEANFRPLEGRARVFIIEDAEKLNEQASNALLKTLEEMPPTSHVVLLTARPANLLPTIRSRVQVVRFMPLTNAEIEQALRIKQPKISSDEMKLKAQLGRGSVGRALAIDTDKYLAQRTEMFHVLEALGARTADKVDRAKLLRHAEILNDAKNKADYEPNLEVLTTLARDAWLLAIDPHANITNADERTRLQRIAHAVGTKRAARWIDLIEELRRRLQININRRIATDQLFLQMAEDQ